MQLTLVVYDEGVAGAEQRTNLPIKKACRHAFYSHALASLEFIHLSKVNTTTQIVVQVRLMLMKKLNLSDHIT